MTIFARCGFALLAGVLQGACGGGSSGGDVDVGGPPPPTLGLGSRPANTTCLAPARTFGAGGYSLVDAFPLLPDIAIPMKLIQPPAVDDDWYALTRNGGLDRFANTPSAVTLERYLNVPVTAIGEGGFLSAVFHPDWPATKQIFVSYTISIGGLLRSRLARLVITDDTTLPATYAEEILLTVDQPRNNHNGGDLDIGPDGYLYFSLGDGGGQGDPNDFAQDTTHLLGSILRIDAIDVPYPAPGYRIPPDNPFAANPRCGPAANGQSCPEIFAWGFRNPWRISFDPPTGRFWVADVGQNAWEEIDVVTRGGNYGWRCREGAHDYNTAACPPVSGLIDPVHEYPHVGDDRSVTGGYVYRGSATPALVGRYLFADFVSGRVWALDPAAGGYTAEELIDSPINIASFSRGNDGEVYALGISTRRIYRIEGSGGLVDDNVPSLLSATGCTSSTNVQAPAPGLVPYAPAAAFWSDGADKLRWIGLPDGTTIDVLANDRWAFPPGTVIVKSFELGNRPVETRLLMRHPDGEWAGYTFEWNAGQTEATRVRGGKSVAIAGQTWIYPSESECLACHTEVTERVLGLETAQLNSTFTYPASGIASNQLAVFNHIGLFSVDVPEPVSANPALSDPFDAGASLDDRARAYLHTNCAQCHQPGGLAGNVDLDLRYATTLAATGACDTFPQAGDLGIVDPRIVAPGDPLRSVLLARVDRRDALGMPPLASTRVDQQGVALLEDWIEGLTGCN